MERLKFLALARPVAGAGLALLQLAGMAALESHFERFFCFGNLTHQWK